MRAAGAALILLACGGMGLGWTARRRQAIALLTRLEALLAHLRTELTQRGTPLPDILREEAARGGPLAAELTRLEGELRRGCPAGQAARPLLDRLSEEWELPDAAEALKELCGLLGRYDAPTQAAACLRAEERLAAARREQEQVLRERGKLYRTVPLALGAMAALAIW